jgi:putative flippase GtrA
MTQTLSDARRFFQDNDWRTILARMNARDTHPMIQFIKYGICGVGAMTLHQSIWLCCSLWLYPAIDSSIPQEVRALHTTYNNGIAFFFSNLFAYCTNVAWVFTSGRHSRVKEFLLFTGVSTLSFIIGLAAGPLLIHRYGIHTVLAQGINVIASVMVNFICRKLFIFKR